MSHVIEIDNSTLQPSESEPKWRDQANDDDNDENDEGNLVDSDDEAPVETGLEIQQNM